MDADGAIVMAVEVKDRQLTLRHTQDKLPIVRSKGIRDLLFLVQGGINAEEVDSVDEIIDREFVTGQNIYICEFDGFFESCQVLLGEAGRRLFLNEVGSVLDRHRADIVHRRKWCSLLGQV